MLGNIKSIKIIIEIISIIGKVKTINLQLSKIISFKNYCDEQRKHPTWAYGRKANCIPNECKHENLIMIIILIACWFRLDWNQNTTRCQNLMLSLTLLVCYHEHFFYSFRSIGRKF